MRVERMILGAVATNCYFAVNEDTKETVIVDPADSAQRISEKISGEGLQLKAILLTHGHGDHMLAAEELRNRFGVPVFACCEEETLLGNPQQNLTTALFGRPVTLKADRWLRDGEKIEEAGFCFQMLATPGHTPGGCCYYEESAGALFSGDTLFCGSVGRTDFPGGSMGTLIRSVEEKLMVLPDETIVYPGHEEETTIGAERRSNPYLRGL